jgi:predicted transcriptional regulator of viral defense system
VLFLTINRTIPLRFLEFKAHFEQFKVFSIQDILKWDRAFDSRRLVEWQAKEYIVRVVNRWYVFTDSMKDERFLYLTANRIYSPSYVSFESALSYYQFIPEGVYTVTSASTLKTHQFATAIGTFAYRRLKPELMFGYRLIEFDGALIKIAQPEKLLLDYLYLNATLQSEDDFASIRLNYAELQRLLDERRLREYLSLFDNKALERRVENLLNLVHHA